jgi:hypothetical protein
MQAKDRYIRYTQAHPELPIFLQPWWLEAAIAGDGDWDVVLHEEGGEIKAILPYCYKKRLGITNLFIPWCTAYLSTYPESTAYTDVLLQQLPAAADYRFRLFPGEKADRWLAGGYTYQISPTHLLKSQTQDSFMAGISNSTFRQIRKAEKMIRVTKSDDFRAAYALWADNMRRKKAGASLVPEQIMNSLDHALSGRHQREIWEARDEAGILHAAIYVVSDSKKTYYLWGGYDRDQRASGATSLLFSHAISAVLQQGKIFDFEGSRINSVAKFYKGFGAEEVPVYSVHKTPSLIGKIWKRGK